MHQSIQPIIYINYFIPLDFFFGGGVVGLEIDGWTIGAGSDSVQQRGVGLNGEGVTISAA